MSEARLRIGYIPLVDAAALFVAVDKGFAEAEGLEIELKREVSWSNVRDKLNIGLFDAAHLLVAGGDRLEPRPRPRARADHCAVQPQPQRQRHHGDAGAVRRASPTRAEGDMTDPMVSARALARVVAQRKERHAEPLTFGMTFPFSNHNYQLRFWMAAGGVDPDEDVRLVVLPPPYMVDSLASGHVDGFCVGAPWNSVAVEDGIGRILHFGCEIVARASEKVLAVRSQWAAQHPETVQRLIRALGRAAALAAQPQHRDEIARVISARIGVEPEVIRRTLAGVLQGCDRRSATTRPALPADRRQCGAAGSAPRPPGSMPRWCGGDRRRCQGNCCRPRARCSDPICSTLPSDALTRAATRSRPMGSAPSPDRPSILRA